MTNAGLILTISSAVLAATGGFLVFKARHTVQVSQGASMALFAHGAFATSLFLFLLTLFHVDSVVPFSFHTHSIADALSESFDCDLSWDCGVMTATLVTAVVLLVAALLGQLSSRALLRQCRRGLDAAGSSTLPRESIPSGVRLWLVHDPRPDAFTIAIVRVGGTRLLSLEETIVVTSGLQSLLTATELRAVLAHEAAHVRAHDDRYLPFVRTLARLVFVDPVLGMLARRLAERYEFGADEDAAHATKDPRSLARALLRMTGTASIPLATVGVHGAGGRSLLLRRIERLLLLADRMEVEV